MNGIHHNVEHHSFEKSFPGCLGRMVNLFELNVGVSATRRLTDKPHREGSPLSRSRSDVTRTSPAADPVEEKGIVSEIRNSRSTRKSNGTPMKMLIAQEMSKDVDSKCSPPNVIAKLMGLDTLPRQETDASMQRNHSRGHSRSHSDTQMCYWEQQNGFFCDIEPHEYKDVYETLQKSPHKGRYDEISSDKRMALVRQKFVEAKRMSMDEKLRQSKQFHDALEVLNSNKDLFLKCLQEPNSMFSHNLYTLPSIPPPEIKRITVLKPSKVANSNDFSGAVNNDGKQVKKGAFVLLNGLEKSELVNSSPARWRNYESPSQATRIVVLKPSPVKPHIKADICPPVESRSIINDDDTGYVEDAENQESREVAKTITQQMREKLGHHCDEGLMSSVFSNGYVGDESSFNKSEMEYAAGNLSDSEVLSPLSRHSWDYINRLGSPFSTSSFGRVSCSPESSVCREAKKRLSERWAMMASNGSCQEQTYARRISSTLGEMLALSETKKAVMSGEDRISNKECKVSNSLADNGSEPIESLDSPKNLMRSKSVPVSFTEYGTRLSTSIPIPDKNKVETQKDDTKERILKSSFKGKVSSLFFSRNKKASKNKLLASETKDESHPKFTPEQDGDRSGLTDEGFQVKLSNKASSSNQVVCAARCPETGFFMEKPVASGNSGENLDQPSPISVLDTPFEEDEHVALVFPRYVRPNRHGDGLPANPVRSNLIDKSPPIGSIARTLSWDDSCLETVSRYSPNQSFSGQGTGEEKQEWFFFVKTLLSVSDLLGAVQSNSFLARWHSPDSPLDPSLRDKYIDLKDKEALHEAKRRLKRSTRKLVFDCVNAALVEIAGYGSVSGQRAIPCIKARDGIFGNTSSTILDEVWNRTNLWLSGEIKCVSDDCGDDNSHVLELVVRKEVVGKGWIDHLILEVDNLGKEIEVRLLEELLEEAVVEFTGRI
ncbi:hypothetical protein F511_08281 [Dorcoceras hygrometricum]|uniref:Uncharacterized protein n=1 Tax=Dorcoceras hygrometricum TaxID=472368 RepID=A0A2Z7AIZ6_9LAMI|nr:hypothetical protein F511_08281 [Dorcoceras hygrometricum]